MSPCTAFQRPAKQTNDRSLLADKQEATSQSVGEHCQNPGHNGAFEAGQMTAEQSLRRWLDHLTKSVTSNSGRPRANLQAKTSLLALSHRTPVLIGAMLCLAKQDNLRLAFGCTSRCHRNRAGTQLERRRRHIRRRKRLSRSSAKKASAPPTSTSWPASRK